MKVRLISYTQPAPELVAEGIENLSQLIGYCARVSNPANQANTDTMDKLIAYLIKHKHWSPFEMADITLEIEAPRDVTRQILRHKSFSIQEFSQRYAEAMGFEYRECRLQDRTNRQNSLPCADEHLNQWWRNAQTCIMDAAQITYERAIEKGIAKEVARAVLPEGLTLSKLYFKGSIRSWIHYLEVRQGVETQKEHREIARACAEVISQLFPVEVRNG